MQGATDEAEAFGDAEWFEACWGGAESGRPVRQMVPAGHAPMPEGTDETEMLGDAEWFEAAWGGAERRHPVRQMVPAGPGRPPPGHLRPDGDHPEPMRAFPSRWPDPEQAAREFPDGPTDKGTGPAPMPRRPDDARGLDDQAFEVFWRGPESVDLLWDDAENRRTIRDRLRRRAPQEQR